MEAVDKEIKVAELKSWARQAIELLDEVKPYRSVFYKQRVAKLKSELSNITLENPLYQIQARS